MEVWTHSPEQTEQVGADLAARLRPGQIVAFRGPLGAGKTTFTRGLARGLGIPGPVTSPTYTLVNEYTCGAVPLFHFDMYRLNNAGELFDIGWEDYLDRGGICVVEWSERVADALENCVTVTIEPVSGAACRRKITIEGVEQDADSGL